MILSFFLEYITCLYQLLRCVGYVLVVSLWRIGSNERNFPMVISSSSLNEAHVILMNVCSFKQLDESG